MGKDKIKKEIEKLRKEIRHHDRAYYVQAQPEISDAEYDRLLKRLELLEKENPGWITPDSPTQRVSGQPLDAFETVNHRTPMLSLGNTYSEEEVKAWEERIGKIIPNEKMEFVAELKIDGAGIGLTYEKGLFTLGASRGD
ncbi:MAG TPA: NAD-dependent DNA ligase LigA, partial [bacterium]|nr:NAD-dependent DNA ligase LigA [bacterium]